MRLIGRARRGLLLAAALAALLLGAALALPRLVDVDHYRPEIAAALSRATGRQVRLGRITASLLPRPGLSVEALAVAEGPRHPGRDALRAERLSLRLGLMDLLRGRVAIRSIVLVRPTITLIRDAGGRWSFDDLPRRKTAAPAAAGAPGAGGPFDLSVDRARLRGGRLFVYDDAATPGARAEAALAPIDAELRGWGGGATGLELSIGLGESRLDAAARLEDGGRLLRARLEADALRAADLVPLLPWAGVLRPPGLDVGGEIDLSGSATLPLDRPEAIRFQGSLVLRGLTYSDAGMTRPLTGLGGRLTVDGSRATWDDFTVTLGRSSLRGRLQVEDFLRPRIGFTLASSRLDVDEIVAAFSPVPTAAAGSRGPAGRPAAPPPPASAPPASGLLEQVEARGRLAVEALRFQTFDLADVEAGAALREGVLALDPVKGSFYGGALAGSARLDLRGAVPAYGLEARLVRVDVAPLLAAYDEDLKGLLRGRLSGGLDVAAAGAGMEAILAGARGAGSLQVTQGAITSFDLLKQLAALLEAVGGRGIGRDETPFDELRARLAIGGGRARTDDLTLRSADLDLAGSGWIGLDARLDLAVKARFSEGATRGMLAKNPAMKNLRDGDGRIAVHFRLRGDLASPAFQLDASAQVRQLGDAAKERLRDRLLERLRKSLAPEEPGPRPEASPTPRASPAPGAAPG